MSSYSAMPASGHMARWSTWDGEHTEVADFRWENEGWTISGQVGREQVQYVVRLSAMWQVRQFLLFRDLDEPDLWLATDGTARWGEMNGAHRVELDGCYDLDLDCTPLTNTLPLHRLPLQVGDSTELPVVTVDVETLGVRRAIHRYTRLDVHRWEFDDGSETVQFDVDRHGLPLDFPERFRRID